MDTKIDSPQWKLKCSSRLIKYVEEVIFKILSECHDSEESTLYFKILLSWTFFSMLNIDST